MQLSCPTFKTSLIYSTVHFNQQCPTSTDAVLLPDLKPTSHTHLFSMGGATGHSPVIGRCCLYIMPTTEMWTTETVLRCW